MSAATDNQRWKAVCDRRKDADGTFFYGVRTTGVFCRPSCSSRRAKRENVTFFATSEQALADRYRPCLRCRPLAGDQVVPATQAMIAVARHIDEHAHEPLTLVHLAKLAKQSPFHVQRSFKACFGLTPKQYHQAARLARFKRSLRDGADVLRATFDAGFGSTSRVYEDVDAHLGMSPSRYRKGGAGEVVNFVVRACSLGSLMMAATERGVCFVHFGEAEEALRAELSHEFPAAELRPSTALHSPELDVWMSALEAHLAQGGPRPDVPLDLRGTAFQIRVWRFLAKTRDGDVFTYLALAKGIGSPKAVRAAASACAANRIAVLIPCHRVLRGDGGLGGYRWGEARKRALLDAEAARSPSAKACRKRARGLAPARRG